MGAQGSQSGISYIEEVTWGVTPSGQFTGINFTSEDMSYGIENKVSDNVRPDRQTSNLVQVGASTEGGMDTEFEVGNIDGLIPGFFWDTDWHAPPSGETVDFTTETAGGVGGLMTVADSSVYLVGQVLKIGGVVSNNGIHTVKALPDSTHVQFIEPLVTEASVAATFAGHYVRNGVTKHSYSIERAHNDVSQFFLYKGMVPNTFEFSVESGEKVLANLSFIGKNETLTKVTNSTPAATDVPTNFIFNAASSIGEVRVGGVILSSCLLQMVDFTLDNKVEGKKAVGTLGFCDAVGKSIELTGNITMYFIDETEYTRYLEATAYELYFELDDGNGNGYIIQIPACKTNEATVNVTGKDDDVLYEAGFTGIVGAGGYSIQMTRYTA